MTSSLTEREMAEIATLKREEGIQRLSGHFVWSEFSGSPRLFHQQFTHDVTMFAVARGFPWPDVIRVARTAKDLFPRMEGIRDVARLLSALRDTLSERLPCLTPVHQHQLLLYLADTCAARQRLLQAVVAGAANVTYARGVHLEVEVPPRHLPLAQGTERCHWQFQQQEAQLSAALRQKEAALRDLRQGSEVNVEEEEEEKVCDGEDRQVDKEGVCELVRASVRANGDHTLDRVDKEASLVSDLLELKLQLTALATGRLQQHTTPSSMATTTASPAVQTQTQTRKRNGPALTKKING